MTRVLVTGGVRSGKSRHAVRLLGDTDTVTFVAPGRPADEARAAVDERTDTLCAALTARDDVVLVTNEVGSGVVPPYRSGGVFRDLLGALNQSVAECCDEVHLVVCGRVLTL